MVRARLMGELGYERFGAAGGDIGSHVSRYLGLDHPDRVVGVHRTKPQTAAVGLTDSPAGLAAWIVEKLRSWSDDFEKYTWDEILTNVMIYWLTGTIGSAMRMYPANGKIPPAQHMRRVEVPAGFSLFPGDLLTPPKAWLERTANLVHLTEPPRGGHFAPFEEPELYAAELREFFRPYRAATSRP